jgi:hypothetical protein
MTVRFTSPSAPPLLLPANLQAATNDKEKQ